LYICPDANQGTVLILKEKKAIARLMIAFAIATKDHLRLEPMSRALSRSLSPLNRTYLFLQTEDTKSACPPQCIERNHLRIKMSFDFLQNEFLNNQVSDYSIALAMPIVGVIGIKLLQAFLLKPLKQWVKTTPNNIDNVIVRIIESRLIPALYLGVIYIAVRNLNLHPILDQAIDAITVVIATVLGIRLMVSLVEYLLRIYCFSPKREEFYLEQSFKTLISN
jgi:predicted membrane chloride channel (bestrophin family)